MPLHPPGPTHKFKRIDSPVGGLVLVARDNKLAAILWQEDRPGRVRLGPMEEAENEPILLKTERQLREYFAGERQRFDLDLDFVGTDFQKSVWSTLLEIPFGTTRTYLEVAESLGSPRGARAVGAANGRNPIAIIAPCHRLIGSSGELAGFAGGLGAKKYLLDLEGVDGYRPPKE